MNAVVFTRATLATLLIAGIALTIAAIQINVLMTFNEVHESLSSGAPLTDQWGEFLALTRNQLEFYMILVLMDVIWGVSLYLHIRWLKTPDQ